MRIRTARLDADGERVLDLVESSRVRRSTLLRTGLAASMLASSLVFIAGAKAGAPRPSSRIRVASAVHVSAARSKDPHNEVLLAADPKDPKRLLGCTTVYTPSKGGFSVVAYSSFDGGATWSQTLETDLGKLTGDPACGFGSNGRAYTVALGGDENVGGEDDSYTYVYRSEDGGRTWGKPVKLGHTDREYVTVDTTGGKYDGRVYLNATGIVRSLDDETQYGDHLVTSIALLHSDDAGASFTPPLKMASIAGGWVLGMGNGVVLSDGTFVALFGEQLDRKSLSSRHPEKANANLKVVMSHDGDRFGKAVVVSDWYMGYGAISDIGSVVPVLAVDSTKGPFHDRLYAVWPDLRSGRSQIFLSTSSDKGKSWSPPVTVNDDLAWPAPAIGPDDILPVVAVNSAGVVGVSWYDRRDHPDNFGWTVRFAASYDGGETFLPSVAVSAAGSNPLKSPKFSLEVMVSGGAKKSEWVKGSTIRAGMSPGTFFYNGGDTAGMAADAAGGFHPFWIDNSTGTAQLWTTTISVDGSAIANGSPQLAGLEDLSGSLTLSITNAEFDRDRKTITADVAVENNSMERVRGPFKVRVLTLRSAIGTPELTTATGGSELGGLLLDYSDEVPGGTLAPDQKSRSLRLELRFPQLASLEPRMDVIGAPRMWLDVAATVFGPPGQGKKTEKEKAEASKK